MPLVRSGWGAGWSRKDNNGSTDGQPAQAFSGASDGPDVGRALGTQTGTGTVGVQRQVHTDEQGNVLAISDDSQATAVSYDIGAFGNVRSGSATDQPLDFVGGQGYQRDADAGTLYVRARHYDPATCEWLSQDPIEGEPAYAYGYNAPTAFTDASGMIGAADRVLLPVDFMPSRSEHERRYRDYQQDKAKGLLRTPPRDWRLGTPFWDQLPPSTKVMLWKKHNRGEGLFVVIEGDPNTPSMSRDPHNPHPVYVDNTPVRYMHPAVKSLEAIRRSVLYVKAAQRDEWAAVLEDLLSPTGKVIVLATLTAWGVGHYFGYGEAIDLALLAVGAATLGVDAVRVAGWLADFVRLSHDAQTGKDLDVAARLFAKIVGRLEVDAVQALLLKKAAKGGMGKARALGSRVAEKGIRGIKGTPDLPSLKIPKMTKEQWKQTGRAVWEHTVKGKPLATFMDEKTGTLYYVEPDQPLLGQRGFVGWAIKAEDAAGLRYGDVPRTTGYPPKVTTAVLNHEPITMVEFPARLRVVRAGTSIDAGGFEHYQPGGRPAALTGFREVNPNTGAPSAPYRYVEQGGRVVQKPIKPADFVPDPNAGYLLSPYEELVVHGGSRLPRGSRIYQWYPDGRKVLVRRVQ